MDLSKEFFFDLERRLKEAGLDSDSESFDVIKARLKNKEKLSPDEFARQAIYVILAGGFSQKTAKVIHGKIMSVLHNVVGAHTCAPSVADATDNVVAADAAMGRNYAPLHSSALFDTLIKIFNNKNKINAAIKLWQNREAYRDGYYEIELANSKEQTANSDDLLNQKLIYLSKLPHIGKITANHLARNLGEDIVKYDIWIQRLGVAFVGARGGPGGDAPRATHAPLQSKINNGNLDPDVKAACDKMFAHLVRETGLPRGYIDVVLWKACQNGLIELKTES